MRPPWFYNSRKTEGERNNKTVFGGGAQKHYPLMKDKELLDLKPFIDNIADTNCIMFMWTTPPRFDFAIDLVKHWGFKYKTKAFCWVKINKSNGMPRFSPGFYSCSNTEDCIIAVRQKDSGFFKPAKPMIQQVILEPIREHSRKPDIVRKNIELMFPSYKKVEVFARQTVDGWDSIGNAIDGTDLTKVA